MFSISGFLSYCFINAFTPGPGNLLALNTMVRYGFKRSRALLSGVFLGYYVVQLSCALMVYFLESYLGSALVYIRYVGAIYIVWLAIHILKSPQSISRLSSPANQCENLYVWYNCFNWICNSFS